MTLTSWSRSTLQTLLLIVPTLVLAQVDADISVNVPPPELPIYDQPPIPDDGYLWTPGYWAWGDDIQDYYWVPGTWVEAPEPDYLWTPGYWGAAGGVFLWHAGYWGPHVGFYGGVNYGHGYCGDGYDGGYWRGGQLYYNRSVNNINSTRITNVYNNSVSNNVTLNRVSYNGGNGGIHAQPTQADLAAARDHHLNDTAMQRQHERAAHGNPVLRAAENQGHPPIAATPRPGALNGPGIQPARQGGTMSVYHANPAQPQNRQGEARGAPPPQHVATPARQPDRVLLPQQQRMQQNEQIQQREQQQRSATPPPEREVPPQREIQSRPEPPHPPQAPHPPQPPHPPQAPHLPEH